MMYACGMPQEHCESCGLHCVSGCINSANEL